jgi:hypothetical protein
MGSEMFCIILDNATYVDGGFNKTYCRGRVLLPPHDQKHSDRGKAYIENPGTKDQEVFADHLQDLFLDHQRVKLVERGA